jgi:hypothetical protein
MLVFWYLLLVGGVNFVVMSGVDTMFWKTGSKGVRRNNRWKAEYNRPIEKRRKNNQQKSGGLNPNSGQVGQNDRPMVNQEIDR